MKEERPGPADRPCGVADPGKAENAETGKTRKWDWILGIQVLIVLWALLFFPSLFCAGGVKMTGYLAWGNLLGVFVSIPLAVFSLIARAKKRFSENASAFILAFSVLNICVGIISWSFFIGVMRML